MFLSLNNDKKEKDRVSQLAGIIASISTTTNKAKTLLSFVRASDIKHGFTRISHLHLDLPYFKYTNQLMILNKSTRKEIRENTHLIYPVKSLSAKCVLLRRRYDCTSPSRRYYHRNWLETHRSFGRPRNWTAPLDPPVSLIEADSIVYRLRREYPVRLRRG